MANKKASKIYCFDQLPDILTLYEAAALLGYCEDHLRKKAIKGEFPAFRLFEEDQRGRWLIHKSDLLEWLNTKRTNVNKSAV